MDLMAIEVGKSLNSNSPKVFYSMVDFGDTPEVTVLMVKKTHTTQVYVSWNPMPSIAN